MTGEKEKSAYHTILPRKRHHKFVSEHPSNYTKEEPAL